jgi:hypothetical protein
VTIAAINAIAAAAIAAVSGVLDANVAAVNGQAWPGGGGSGSTTTWNPADKTAGVNLSGGDLTWSETNVSFEAVRSTSGYSTGKSYWQIVCGVTDQGAFGIRVIGDAIGTAVNGGTTASLRADGSRFVAGGCATVGSSPGGFVITTVLQFAADWDAGKLWVTNGATFAGDPAAGTGEQFTFPPGTYHIYAWSDNNSGNCGATLNCGAVAFAHPSVFAALQGAGFTAA